MIKWIKVRNPYEEELTINLTESEPTHGLLLSGITGLGPTASLSFSEYALLDGAINTNARVEKRTIGISFMLTFAPDIETSRQQVYRYFPVKGKVRLYVATDHRTVYIDGLVESIDPDIFAEQETVTVNIVCEDPYFKGTNSVIDLNLDDPNRQVLKQFEFPFQNASDNPEISFGEQQIIEVIDNRYKYYYLNYDGDFPTGVSIAFEFNNPAGNLYPYIGDNYKFKIRNSVSGEETVINIKNFTYIQSGSIAYILYSSQMSKKYIASSNNKIYTSSKKQMNFLNLTSDWLNIYPRSNILELYFTDANDNVIDVMEDTFPKTYISLNNVYQGV